MKRLIGIELIKLRTTPAIYVSLLVTVGLGLAAVVTGVELAGQHGTPQVGVVDNVAKTLSVAALTSMVMLVMGILMAAGEYRHRTIAGTYLAEPRRGRVLVAKLVTAGTVGAALGAAVFGLALAVAVPLYARHGVHVLPVPVGRLWLGATVVTACYGLLGVGIGTLTRSTVAAIIVALTWVQIIEVGILQSVAPTLAKWLPTGAGVALTGAGSEVGRLLAPATAAVVLLAWAGAVAAMASRSTLGRDVR
jgi:ABC-2 type transport system permease protein